MKVIVPLAGPDFILKDGSLKPLQMVKGRPLLKWVLSTRPWLKSGNVKSSDYIFVLLDHPQSREFVGRYLLTWFPEATINYVGRYTCGAALTTLCATAVLSEFDNEPVCVDLADIYFESSCPLGGFYTPRKPGALVPSFKNSNPSYSYLEVGPDGSVSSAQEKVVVSDDASAGVYLFRNARILISAISQFIQDPEEYTCNGLFYVCPLLNYVVRNGWRVEQFQVTNVVDVKNP